MTGPTWPGLACGVIATKDVVAGVAVLSLKFVARNGATISAAALPLDVLPDAVGLRAEWVERRARP
jgi:hypothetical protein